MKRGFVLFLGLALGACNYNRTHGEGPATGVVNLQNVSQIDYSVVKGAILDSRCVSCHSNAGGNQGGTNLETYSNVRRFRDRIVFRAGVRKDMPPRGPLSDSAIQLLREWVNRGAPENTTSSTVYEDPTLDAGPTDWSKVSNKIFARKCNQCHSAPAPDGDLDLTSLAAVKAKATKIFDRTVVQKDMPLAPFPTLTPRELQVMMDWFIQGMP